MLRRLLFPAAMLFLVSGCQSSMLRSFDQVQAGMDKHQVLEAMGSPTTTTRMHGKDRWIYRFYDDKIRFEKEVHFLNGIVVHKGEAWEPTAEKSAETKDKNHAEIEATHQAEIEKREEARKANADAYAEYERKSRNAQDVKYMPSFIDLK